MLGITPANWGRASAAEAFITRYRLTFTNLWDSADAAWRHYGSPYTSQFWLLDHNGDRLGDGARTFSASTVQGLLRSLE